MFDYEVKEGHFRATIDTNKDGQPVVSMGLNLSEAIQEMIKRGTAVENVKVVGFKFMGTKMVLKLDTDKDGEHVLDLEIDLLEAADEIGLA